MQYSRKIRNQALASVARLSPHREIAWNNAARSVGIRVLKLVLLSLLLCASLLATRVVRAAEKPNIVIILADDLGWGDPQCNNPNSKIATPNIDRIAKEGIRFTDAHSPASWCTPTRYGLLTGRYPFRTSLKWREEPVIEPGRLTLPAMLRDHGYRTAMVGKWHLGFEIEQRDRANKHEGGPVDRGFDTYFGIPSSLDIPPFYYLEGNVPVSPPTEQVEAKNTPGWSRIQGEFWRAGGIAPGFKHVEVLPVLTARAEKEIHDHHFEHGDKPLFLYMALPAPHTPWVPTREFAGKSDVPLYGDFVQQVDATVGLIQKALEETGMSRDTLFIFTSDNGPVWYEEDEEKYGHKSTSEYRGMKGDAWEGGHRMPFLLSWPNKAAKGVASDQLICHTDIFATCAKIVGHELPNDAAEDSVDFSDALLKRDFTSHRQTLVVNSTQDFMMVRQGNMKLIPFRGSGGFSKPKHIKNLAANEAQGQLYNLESDPSETKNLYQDQPDDVAKLTELLERIKTGRTRSAN